MVNLCCSQLMLLHFAVGVIINIVGTVIVLRFVVNACITLNLWG